MMSLLKCWLIAGCQDLHFNKRFNFHSNSKSDESFSEVHQKIIKKSEQIWKNFDKEQFKLISSTKRKMRKKEKKSYQWENCCYAL